MATPTTFSEEDQKDQEKGGVPEVPDARKKEDASIEGKGDGIREILFVSRAKKKKEE